MDSTPDRLNAALEGRYAIERELGAGGMANVYLAHDLKHDRKVAVKVLKPELAAVLGADRFVQEIRTVAGLHHPNILPLFDSGQADGYLYYVMPYVEGETLRDRLNRETQLGIREAVRIATEAAEALAYAHQHGIVHRDIKPENILLHAERPLVADFGIALAVSAAAGGRMTETGLSLGTPHYMSPEQASAEKQVTARSDIYSLGAVLYEMLTGEPPHTGASAQAIILKIITEPVQDVARLRSTVPPGVAAAVAMALEKLPADRFKDARAFAESLANPGFRASTSALPVRESAEARVGRWPPGVRLWAMATMVATVVAIFGWLHGGSGEPRPMILTETGIPDGTDGLGTSLALSPDGTLIAFVSERDGTRALSLLDRRTLETRTIPGAEDANTPFFSPDGLSVGFVTNGFVLKTTTLRGEARLTLAEKAVRTGAHWGDDGWIYFAVGATSGETPGLRRVSAEGGAVETLTRVDTAEGEIAHYFPHLLPGGRGVLFTVVRDHVYDASSMEVAVADLETGSHRSLLKGVVALPMGPGFVVVITADGEMLGVPFDEQRLTPTGPAVLVREGVRLDRFGNTDVSVTSTGTLIYLAGESGNERRELILVDHSGRTEPFDTGWVGHFTNALLSPDGTRLAASVLSGTDEQIWVKDLERGPRWQLRNEGGNPGRLRSWTPDGRAVAFWKAYTLTVSPVDGGPQVEWIEGGWPGSISFSPDGEQAVFTFAQGGQLDLYAMRRGSSVPRPLVATDHAESGGQISPDGRWLAFVSDESGNDDVYLRPYPADRSGETQRVTFDGATTPRWSPDSRELYYLSRGALWTVGIALGTSVVMGAPQRLFETYGFVETYDVVHDGRQFLMIRRPEIDTEGLQKLVVMDNLPQYLSARARQ